MTILVLGSKPKARLVEYKKAYCANSASSFYSKDLKEHGENITAIISASELVDNKRIDNTEKTNWLKAKQIQLCDNSKDSIILLKSEFFLKNTDLIAEMGFKGHLECFSDLELSAIIHLVLKKKIPILTKEHFSNSSIALLTLKNYLKDKFKIFYNDKREYSGLFRPSTGILSLLIAIYMHGDSASYHVSGIGITDRGVYPDGWLNTWTPESRLNSFHVIVDKAICELLSKKYNIFFDDQSLSYLNS